MGSGLLIRTEYCKTFSLNVKNAQATFGDADFINCGGQLLFRDADDDPYLEVVVPPSDDEIAHGDWIPEAKWTIYQVLVEKFQVVEQDHRVYLVCAEWRPDWSGALSNRDEWFHRGLSSIAEHEGVSLQVLRSWFCSTDPVERARGYLAVASVNGWYEFDQYPLQLLQHDVHLRYEQRSDCACELCKEDPYEN